MTNGCFISSMEAPVAINGNVKHFVEVSVFNQIISWEKGKRKSPDLGVAPYIYIYI